MAITSTTPSQPAPPEMTFYCLGMPASSRKFGSPIEDYVFSTAQKSFKDIVPTTYEASKVYLDEELCKPEGHRDLRREMCLLMVVAIPNNQKILFKSDATESLIELSEGSTIFYPTVDLPPDAFGTPGNRKSNMLVNKETLEPTQATVLFAYFSRRRGQGDSDVPADIPSMQLNISAFA